MITVLSSDLTYIKDLVNNELKQKDLVMMKIHFHLSVYFLSRKISILMKTNLFVGF